ARRIADLRLALGIISAPDARDPRYVPAPLEGPALDGPVRVAVVRDPLGAGIDPHVRAGVDRAAGWMADAGYDVVVTEPPQIAEATAAWVDAMFADVGTIWPGMEPVAGSGVIEFINACTDKGVFRPVDQAAQLAAWVAAYRI